MAVGRGEFGRVAVLMNWMNIATTTVPRSENRSSGVSWIPIHSGEKKKKKKKNGKD